MSWLSRLFQRCWKNLKKGPHWTVLFWKKTFFTCKLAVTWRNCLNWMWATLSVAETGLNILNLVMSARGIFFWCEMIENLIPARFVQSCRPEQSRGTKEKWKSWDEREMIAWISFFGAFTQILRCDLPAKWKCESMSHRLQAHSRMLWGSLPLSGSCVKHFFLSCSKWSHTMQIIVLLDCSSSLLIGSVVGRERKRRLSWAPKAQQTRRRCFWVFSYDWGRVKSLFVFKNISKCLHRR